tara:strand:+ start:451 stop:1404 length:954 start_codon:yes stop_codon:yes gene_type:complete
MSLLKADTIKPVTSSGDLSLQGDSGGSAVDCLNITSAGDINFTGNTDAKIKLPSAGGIYESDGSTAILTETGAAVTLDNVALGSSVGIKLARNAGLIVKYVSATTVDIDADFLTLYDSSNFGYIASTVNLTAAITASGVNGLDTGSEASSTWYHIWVIYNGTTVASLLSTSPTAPTLPSGYTDKKYVGAVYNDSGDNFDDFHQVGNDVSTADAAAFSNVTATSYASQSLAAFVPITAVTTTGYGRALVNSSTNAQATFAGADDGKGAQELTAFGGADDRDGGGLSITLLTPQTIFLITNSTGAGSYSSTGYTFEGIV